MTETPLKKDPKEGVVRTPMIGGKLKTPVEPVTVTIPAETEEKPAAKPLEEEIIELLDKRIRAALLLTMTEEEETDEDSDDTDYKGYARIEIVTDFLKEAQGLLDDGFRKKIAKKHKVSLFRRPGDKFPDGKPWMKVDDAIARNLSKYSFFYPLLNFIFNETRYPKEAIDKIEKLTGGRRYEYTDKKGLKQSRIYAAFIVNQEFYDKVQENVFVEEAGIKKFMPKATAKKYLSAMIKAGLIVQLWNKGKFGRLCADGYYTDYEGKLRKQTIFKKSPDFKNVLKTFKY